MIDDGKYAVTKELMVTMLPRITNTGSHGQEKSTAMKIALVLMPWSWWKITIIARSDGFSSHAGCHNLSAGAYRHTMT